MINFLLLEDAREERPSRTQLARLAPGDELQLKCNGVQFWVTLLSIITPKDMVGRLNEDTENLEYAIPEGYAYDKLRHGSLVGFETKHIIKKVPGINASKLARFMLLTHPASDEIFVFHLNYPQMIAKILKQDRHVAIEEKWFDLPADKTKVAPHLLEEMADWYFYNYITGK